LLIVLTHHVLYVSRVLNQGSVASLFIQRIWFYLNQLNPRVILLMMLAVCMNATILLEQPANTLLEYYPRLRDFMEMLRHIGGPHCVP
jgi:hypothetical protein